MIFEKSSRPDVFLYTWFYNDAFITGWSYIFLVGFGVNLKDWQHTIHVPVLQHNYPIKFKHALSSKYSPTIFLLFLHQPNK